MEHPMKDTLLNSLQIDWADLPTRFHLLTSSQQEGYLVAQGYQRFADLLAHITAWWERGIKLIEHYRENPRFSSPSVNVNEFNATAVATAQGMSEDEVVKAFMVVLRHFVKLIDQLNDNDWQDERIIRQLEMEIIGHYQEHRIK